MYDRRKENRKLWLESAKIQCALCRKFDEAYHYEFISARQYERLLRVTKKVGIKIKDTVYFPYLIYRERGFIILLPHFTPDKFKIDLEPFRLRHKNFTR